MLPRDLRLQIFNTASLTVLQSIDEKQRQTTANSLADEEYVCSGTFCRNLLVNRFALTAGDIAEAYDARLFEQLLLPLDLVVKIALLKLAPAYEQHLYRHPEFALFAAAKAGRSDLIRYYLVRYPFSHNNVLECSALHYYLERLPDGVELARELARQRVPIGMRDIYHARDIAAGSRAEKYLLQYRFAELATLDEFQPRVLPLWIYLLPAALVRRMPELRTALLRLPASPAREYYLNVAHIVLNGLPIAGSTYYLSKLLDVALTVMNLPAVNWLRARINEVATGGPLMENAIWQSFTTVSEVAYYPELLQQSNMGNDWDGDIGAKFRTSLFLSGQYDAYLRMTTPARNPYDYRSDIEVELRALSGAKKPSDNLVSLRFPHSLLREFVTESTMLIVAIETLEDAVKVLPLIEQITRGVGQITRGVGQITRGVGQITPRVICCPTSIEMLKLLVAAYPELAALIPAQWGRFLVDSSDM